MYVNQSFHVMAFNNQNSDLVQLDFHLIFYLSSSILKLLFTRIAKAF